MGGNDPHLSAESLIEQHGNDAPFFIVERMRELALAGDDAGAREWARLLREVRLQLQVRRRTP
jgi:hypothetical protein